MSAGVVYVEFDLDFSKMEKGEQKVKDSSKATAAAVEGEFKKAGSASETVFESIGKSAASSFEEVKTHAKGTAEAIFSSMANAAKGIMDDVKTATASYTQGVRDFASKTGEFLKNTAEKIALIGGTWLIFGKAAASAMSAVLSWIGIIYAAYKALDFAIGLVTGKSYKSENINALIAERDAVRDLAKEMGTTATAAQEMRTAIKLMGGDQSTLTTVYGGMRTALRDNREELDRLGVQYEGTNGKLLDQRTILTNVKTTLEKYAEGWDRTQAEQAIGMGSLEQINKVLGTHGDVLQKAKADLDRYHTGIGPESSAAIDEYQKSMTVFKYETDMMSQGFSRAIADQVMPAFTALSKLFAGGWPYIVDIFRYSAATVTSLLWGIANAFNLTVDAIKGAAWVIADIFIMIGKAAAATMRGDFAGASAAVSDGWKNIKTSVSKTWDEMVKDSTKASGAMKMAWAFDERKDQRKKTGDAWVPPPLDDESTNAASKGGRQMADMLAALTKQNKEFYDSSIKSADAWAAKQRADYAYEGDVITEFYSKREDALDTWYDKQWDAIEQNVADEKKRNEMLTTLNLEYGRKQETDQTNQLTAYTAFTKKKMEAEYSAYDAIKGYGVQAYEAKLKLLEEERKRIYAITGDEALANKWLTEQKEKAFERYAEKEGKLMDRLAARWTKYKRETVDTSKAMYNAIDAGAQNLEKQMSANFFNAFTGNMSKVTLDWRSMWDSMLQSASDYLARLVAEAALNSVANVANSGLSWLGNILGLTTSSGVGEGIGNVLFDAVDTVSGLLGFAEGAWEINRDMPVNVHAGEMIVPADQAEAIRQQFMGIAGGGAAGAATGFTEGRSSFSISEQASLAAFMNAATSSLTGSALSKGGGALLAGKIGSLSPASLFSSLAMSMLSGALAAASTNYSMTMLAEQYGIPNTDAGWMSLSPAAVQSAQFEAIYSSPVSNFLGSKAGEALSTFAIAQYAADWLNQQMMQVMGIGGYEGMEGPSGGGGGDGGGAGAGPGGGGGDGGGFKSGLDYVPRDNFRARLHEGEAVLNKAAAEDWRSGRGGSDGAALPPVQVNWQVDGKTLASIIYKQSRAGVKVLHSRGMTSV